MTDAQYEAKFKEMQKYIPFLQKVIEKLKVNNAQQGDNPRKAQLQKMEMLHELLTNKAKKLKMETLMKCEGVLIKLHAKIEKQSTLLQNEDSILNNMKLKANNKPSTSTAATLPAAKNKPVEDISGPASPPPEIITIDDIDQPVVIPTERRCSPIMHNKEEHRNRQDQDHRQQLYHRRNSSEKHKTQEEEKVQRSTEKRQDQIKVDKNATNATAQEKQSHHHSHRQHHHHHHDSSKDNRSTKDHYHNTSKDLNSPGQNSPSTSARSSHHQHHVPKDSHTSRQSPNITKNIPPTSPAQTLQTVTVVITEPLPAYIKQQHFAPYHQNLMPRETICHSNLRTLPQMTTNRNDNIDAAREANEAYNPEDSWEEFNHSQNKSNSNKSSSTVFSRLGEKVAETSSTSAAAAKTAPISIPGRYTPIPDVLKSPPLSAHDINNLLMESGDGGKLSKDISEIGSRRPPKPAENAAQEVKRNESPPTNSLDAVRKKLTQIVKLNSPQPETPLSPPVGDSEKTKEKDANKMSSPLPNERVALKYNPHPRQERLQSISSNEGSESSTQSRVNDPRLKSKLHFTNPLHSPSAAHITPANVNVLPSINYSDPRLKRQNSATMYTAPPPSVPRTALLPTPSPTTHQPAMSFGASLNPPLPYGAVRQDPRIARALTPARRLSTSQPHHYSSEENWDSEPEERNHSKPHRFQQEQASEQRRIDPRLAFTPDRSRSVSRGPPPDRDRIRSVSRGPPSDLDRSRSVSRGPPPVDHRQSQSQSRVMEKKEPEVKPSKTKRKEKKEPPPADLPKAKAPKSDSEDNWDSEPESTTTATPKEGQAAKSQPAAASSSVGSQAEIKDNQTKSPVSASPATVMKPNASTFGGSSTINKEEQQKSDFAQNTSLAQPLPQKPKRNSDSEENWDSEPEIVTPKPVVAAPLSTITKDVSKTQFANDRSPVPQTKHYSPQSQMHILSNPFGNPIHPLIPPSTLVPPPAYHVLTNPYNNLTSHPPHPPPNFYVPPPGIQTSEAHNRFSAVLNDKSERIKYFEAKKQKAPEPAPRTYKEFREAKQRAQAQEAAAWRAKQAAARKVAEQMNNEKEKVEAVETNKKPAEAVKGKNPSQQKPLAETAKSAMSTFAKDSKKAPTPGESTLDKMYRTQNFNSSFPKASTSFKIPKKHRPEDKPKEEAATNDKPKEVATKDKPKEAAATKDKEEAGKKTIEKEQKTNEDKKKKSHEEIKKTDKVVNKEKTVNLKESVKVADNQNKVIKEEKTSKLTNKSDNEKTQVIEDNHKEQQKEKLKEKEIEKEEENKNSSDNNKNIRDPRCRPKTEAIKDISNDKDNSNTLSLSNIVITSSDSELTLKPQTNKETQESPDEKYKAALEKFNKTTQDLAAPKPQRILRRRDTMIQFGSAPLVDKDKLLNANALLFEDIQEQSKRKNKKAEEERQIARRNKHLEEMFQKTDDNCTVSTQNIITGKRRTRTTMNFNETVLLDRCLKTHFSKRDSTGGAGSDLNATPPTSSAKTTRAAAKTKKSDVKEKSQAAESEEEEEKEDKHSDEDEDEEEIPLKELKEAKAANKQKQTNKNDDEAKEPKEQTKNDEEKKNSASTTKGKGKAGQKRIQNKPKKTATEEIPTVSIPEANITNDFVDEHQNCAVSSTSPETPTENKPTSSSTFASRPCKKEPDNDNEPTSTANKSNRSTPTPDASRDVLNDIIQNMLKPDANRQHILGMLGEILSEDRLEIIKSIIDNSTTQENSEQQTVQNQNKKIKNLKSEAQEEQEGEEETNEVEDEEEEDEEEEEDHKAASSKPIKEQKKKPLKKRTELDRLNEDIRDMFICEGVLTATGRRMCTIMGQTSSKDEESSNKISPKTMKEPAAVTTRRRGPKTNVEKRKIAASTPLRRSLRSVKTYDEEDEESNDSNTDTTSDTISTDTPPRKMPVLKPHTPIKLPEEDEKQLKEVANKRKSDNKPCPKSKKPKSVQAHEDESKDNSENESEIESLQSESINAEEAEEQKDEVDENTKDNEESSIKIKNNNVHWHNHSKYINWCMLCEKKILAATCAFHYKMHHGENYISRLPPVLLQKFKQGKLSQPLFGVDKKPKQPYWFHRCPFCLKYFNTPMPLWLEHFQNHTAEYRYECSRCHTGSNRPATTKRHISTKCKGATMVHSTVKLTKPTLIKAHVCHLCNFMQLKRANLERHYVEQHQLESKNVDVLGYTITLFDVENVEQVPEVKASEREREAWKSIESEEQVIDIEDDEEEEQEEQQGEKASTSADKEITKVDKEIEKESNKAATKGNKEKQNEKETEKPNSKVLKKEKVEETDKDKSLLDNKKDSNNQKEAKEDNQKKLSKQESLTNESKEKENIEKEKIQALSSLDTQKEKKLTIDTSKTNLKGNTTTDSPVTDLNIQKDTIKSTDEKEQNEEPVTLAKKVITLEPIENQIDLTKESEKETLAKSNVKTKTKKKKTIVDLVIIEDDAVQDIQDELLHLAAQHAAEEEKQQEEKEQEEKHQEEVEQEEKQQEAQQEKVQQEEPQQEKPLEPEEVTENHDDLSANEMQNELLVMAEKHAAQEQDLTANTTKQTEKAPLNAPAKITYPLTVQSSNLETTTTTEKAPINAPAKISYPQTLLSSNLETTTTTEKAAPLNAPAKITYPLTVLSSNLETTTTTEKAPLNAPANVTYPLAVLSSNLETTTTISDLISNSIDRIYNKRKSTDANNTSEPKKPFLAHMKPTSNAFMPSRDENSSSPTIQILAQSIINIEEQAQQTEMSAEKPVSISIAERLSQRFKGLQDKANLPSVSTAKESSPSILNRKPNPFEQLFNDTVEELEKEKDKQNLAEKEVVSTSKESSKPSGFEDITVISDDEDWEDIEITESAPTSNATASSSGNMQKSKNKGLFQKFNMFKGNNTKTKKHMPPMVFMGKKKPHKEKSQLTTTSTTTQSTTSSPTPTTTNKSTTTSNDKSDVATTTTNSHNAHHLGFKPVINIMDDLLPDSPCNDPIDLVPELAPLEPLQDLNDISSILDSNLGAVDRSVVSINLDDDHHTSMEDALDFISEQQAQDKQKTGHIVSTISQTSGAQSQGKSIINNITHVGFSVQTSGDYPFKFYCLLQNCTFLFSSDSVGLENHFLCEHAQIKWNGYCLMCQKQCFENENEEHSIAKEIKHMMENHASKPQLELINEHSTCSSVESAGGGSGGGGGPKIKLRRMTGDCLSKATSDNSTPLADIGPNNTTETTPGSSLTMLGALLVAKPKPPTIEMPPQPQMQLTEPLLLNSNEEVSTTTPTPFKNIGQDFLITSVSSAAVQPKNSPLQISSVISLNPQPTPASTPTTEATPQLPKISSVRTLSANSAGNKWAQQIHQDRQELMESAAESLEVSRILANAGRPSITREPTRALDDSPGPVLVAETVPVAQAKTGDFLITQTVSAQYNENSSAAVGFNISIASSSAIANTQNEEAIPTDITTPITSRQYKCMARDCKFVSRVPVAMSQHLRFHERRNLSHKRDYFACAFCAHQADSVEDYMKHADQYHIINKGGAAVTVTSNTTTTAANENTTTANSLTRKIQNILNSNKSLTVTRSTESHLQNQNLPEQDSEEVYMKKLKETIEEIVKPTGLPDDKLYRCVVKNCRTQLTESTFLNHIMYHITTVGGNPNNYNFKCPHCTAQYHRVSGIKAHIKNHAHDRYFCYMCEQTSTNAAQILKHFSEKHWNTLNMYTKVLLNAKTTNDRFEETSDSSYYVAYTQELSDEDVRKFGEKLILEWQRKKSGSKTHFKSSEIDLLPLPAIFQREVNCGECEYKTKVRTNMYRHLLMHKQNPGLANTMGGLSKVASVDPVNPVPCLNSSERFFDKMTNLASSSLVPNSSSSTSLASTSQTNANNLAKPAYKIPYSYVLDGKRFTCFCPGCSYLTPSEETFRTHLNSLHKSQLTFRCPFCQEEICKRGLTVDRIINHIRFHGATIYRCEECNYLHHMRYVVERHINEKHSSIKVNIVTHERSGEDNAEGVTTTVSFAGKKYKANSDPNQQSPASTSATTLRSSNSESSSLKSNNASSSNSTKGKSKWLCDLCDHKASTLAQIQAHSQQIHGQKCQYKCVHCNFGSQQLSQILHHIDEKHSGKTREASYMYHKSVNCSDEVADTRPLWQRNDPTRVRHIRGILMEDEEESEEYRKKMELTAQAEEEDEEQEEEEEDDAVLVDATSTNYILGYEFACYHCEFKSQTFSDLETHYQSRHNHRLVTAKPFWYRLFRRLCCPECRQFIGNFIELQKHLLYKHNTNRYCAADVTMAENDDSPRLLCGYCSFHCSSVELLYRHNFKAQHLIQDVRIDNNEQIMDILRLGKSQPYYRCTLCGDIYPNTTAMVDHACNVHAKEDGFSFRELSNTLIYRCAECIFTSTNEMDLLRHMIDHMSCFKNCQFCESYHSSFVGYMQHCYAEHRTDIRKFRDLYTLSNLTKYFLNLIIIFPTGLTLLKKNLVNTKYGNTVVFENYYEEIYKISQQPPIPRLSIARLVARKSVEAQQKQTTPTGSASPNFEAIPELFKPMVPAQAKKISKRRCTVAVSQEDNAASKPKPKLTVTPTTSTNDEPEFQKPKKITQRRKTLTLEPVEQNDEFNAPLALQPKKISKRRRTVAVDCESSAPYHSNATNSFHSLLIERDLASKKRKTSSSSSTTSTSPAINQEPPHYPSNLDMEPFSYYGIKPEPLDLSTIYTKVAIGGIKTPLTINKFRQLFNIDCQLNLTKCDQHTPKLDYIDYKHIKKACPASHKIRFN